MYFHCHNAKTTNYIFCHQQINLKFIAINNNNNISVVVKQVSTNQNRVKKKYLYCHNAKTKPLFN